MIGFPFDSHVTYDSEGTPQYDRAVASEPLRKLISEMFSTGINPLDSSAYQVSAGSDMNVVVSAGFAVIKGCLKLEESDRILAVQASDTSYDRIDTVVLRLNTNDDVRSCDLYVVEGIPASSPVHPELTRTSSIYEIGLADLFITKQSTSIPSFKITDTRYDDERCGVIAPIAKIDTTTLDQQMRNWAVEQQTEFEAWVDTIKDILDAETAGHLQNEIETIKGELGSADISDIGDGTLTGAISKHEEDVNSLNASLVISRKTLASGETTVTFTDSRITADSVFEFYASVYGIVPTEVSVSGTTVTTTWTEQDSDIEVGMCVR